MNGEKTILLFDGICNLCSGTVQFTIKRDPKKRILFASLQEAPGQKILSQYGLQGENFKSIVLVEEGKVYTQSTAVLKLLKKLDGLWPLLYVFIIVPPPIRNFFYDKVSQNRYRWFGKKDQCWLPTRDLQERFLK